MSIKSNFFHLKTIKFASISSFFNKKQLIPVSMLGFYTLGLYFNTQKPASSVFYKANDIRRETPLQNKTSSFQRDVHLSVACVKAK